MSEKQFYISTEQLREEYQKRLKQMPPRRARGMSPASFMFLVLFPLTIAIIVMLVKITKLDVESAIIIACIISFGFFDSFHNWKYRTARHTFRKYPQLRAVIKRLNEPGSKFLRWLPVLKINGKDVFLVHYGYVRWWVLTGTADERGEFNGWALLDSKGRFIENPELLEKAKSTFILGVLGGDDYLYMGDNQRVGWSLHTIRRILPKARKILEKQEREFERYGLRPQWEKLVQNIPQLSQAMQEGLTIYEGKKRWRKAIGWRWGLEYRYEDAEEYLRMCLAYSQYMAAAYGNTLVEIITTANQLMYTVSTETDWRGRKKAMWALSMLMAAAKGVESWIFTYGVLGKVTEEEMGWYRRKLNRAREIGLPIVRE